MHIYPQDYKPSLVHKWIDDSIEFGNFSIDIRFTVPNDMHSMTDKGCTNQISKAGKILGEIAQEILKHDGVDGSITLSGTTATILL